MRAREHLKQTLNDLKNGAVETELNTSSEHAVDRQTRLMSPRILTTVCDQCSVSCAVYITWTAIICYIHCVPYTLPRHHTIHNCWGAICILLLQRSFIHSFVFIEGSFVFPHAYLGIYRLLFMCLSTGYFCKGYLWRESMQGDEIW